MEPAPAGERVDTGLEPVRSIDIGPPGLIVASAIYAAESLTVTVGYVACLFPSYGLGVFISVALFCQTFKYACNCCRSVNVQLAFGISCSCGLFLFLGTNVSVLSS